jgi:hypothetical protein
MYKGGVGNGGAGTGIASPFAPVSGMHPATKTAYLHTQSTASTGTIAASTAPAIWQPVEFGRTLSGRSATFSLWLWSNVPITISNIIARQNFGTGGSPSPQVVIDNAVNWNVTNTPTRFSVRIDFPSAANATLGTAGDYVGIGIWLPPGVVFNIATTQWQLEECSPNAPAVGYPTAFEYRGIQQEAARFGRFYETGEEPFMYLGGLFSGITTAYGDVKFQTLKRITPVITTSGFQYYQVASNVAFTPSSISPFQDKFQWLGTGLTNWNGWAGTGNWVADARL